MVTDKTISNSEEASDHLTVSRIELTAVDYNHSYRIRCLAQTNPIVVESRKFIRALNVSKLIELSKYVG